MKKIILSFCCIAFLNDIAIAQTNFVKENFAKMDTTISMRDGVKLYTVIYIPKDQTRTYPFLMERTPYSAGPYGDTLYPNAIGPNETLMKEQFIFVNQDVRGRYMSEGLNLEVTPYIINKKNKTAVDESSDTYDTIEWLLKNIKNNNGRVGLYGISYPGFYATASLPGAHTAIKAVSPQAPVTDEFMGDDANHNGAFFLLDNFSFMNYFGANRNGPVKNYSGNVFNFNTKDVYQFFLKLGPIKNTQSAKYYNNKSYIWNEYLQHDTYDDYWKARNIRQHLNNITIPTMVVGGWFDAEDLFGALQTYKAIEKGSTAKKNYLVMGPWTHGAWESKEWKQFTYQDFGSNTSNFFQDTLEAKFFNFYLKDKGNFSAAAATIFETGSNQWKNYTTWPPQNVSAINYFLNSNNKISLQPPAAKNNFDEYVSDPAKPVPYTNGIYGRRNNEYMAEDQRFAALRQDVLVYETEVLTEDVTLAGNIIADLQVSTSSTDVDFIVKLIDVYPDIDSKNKLMSGYQLPVAMEVFRGRFRKSFEKPEPLIPGKPTEFVIDLHDINHTFKKGHKIMIQVQSTWFPVIDRNPQKYVPNIFEAKETDFIKAEQRIYFNSYIELPVMKN